MYFIINDQLQERMTYESKLHNCKLKHQQDRIYHQQIFNI